MSTEHQEKKAPSKGPDRPSSSDEGREPASEPASTGVDAESASASSESALEAVTRQRDEYLDMVRHVQADFENYKKRMVRQQTDLLERAAESLVVKLLPVLDAFELARAHLEAEGSTDSKALLAAAGLLSDTLGKEGLERFGEAGETFDPTDHEAVEHEPASAQPEMEDDSADKLARIFGAPVTAPTDRPAAAPAASGEPVVSAVLRRGYRYKGRVVRPAMVKVRG